MKVIRRDRTTGNVAVLAILGAKPAPITVSATKPKKQRQAKPEGHVSVPRDASDGESLAFRLHNALLETDISARNKQVFACGKLARDIGLGDPDVAIAYEAALKDQKSAHYRDNVESDLFRRWGTFFIGGFTAKRVNKGEGTFKPWQLVVQIPGEKPRTATYATPFEAHRAGCRWWVLKSEAGQHAGMRVHYQETEPGDDDDRIVKCFPSGNPCVTEIAYEEAAAAAQSQTSREKHGPAMRQGSKPRSLGFGAKAHETRVTFSRG